MQVGRVDTYLPSTDNGVKYHVRQLTQYQRGYGLSWMHITPIKPTENVSFSRITSVIPN